MSVSLFQALRRTPGSRETIVDRKCSQLDYRRLSSKIFYAVLLSPLQPEQSTLSQPESALFADKSSYKRAISMVNLINGVIPGIADKLAHWMYSNNRLPWAPVDIELIAAGSGAAVFRLKWKHGDKVLRIYRKSLGKSSRGLLSIAKYYKRNYEMVLAWYGNSLELMLPMEFLVMQGLPLIGPVAASLQPYVHGQKQDLFRDFSDDELLRLLQENNYLRDQFIFFAQQTIQQWTERRLCYDLLGRENIMLAKEGTNLRLRIVDVGIFNLETLASERPETMSQLEQRMNRLSSLHKAAREI